MSIEIVQLRVNLSGFDLQDVTFSVPAGGYGVVIGAAGSGKTTLLEAIAGVSRVSAGSVRLNGADVTNTAPEQRGVGLVYQHSYLFPHLSVRGNVAYGAREPGDANEMIERFGLAAIAERSVHALSGGERQLVAIARALASRPDVLLLDEPFAALDPGSRAAVRREVRTIYFERRFTVLHVTHDFAEAGLLGDIAVLLDHGRVLQSGDPEQLFRRPASAYVASFLGAENVFSGEARPIRAHAPDWVESRDGELEQQPLAFTTGTLTLYALGDAVPGNAHAIIRAEDVMLSLETLATSVRNQFPGTIVEIAPAGALSKVTVDVNGTPLVAAVTTRSSEELGLSVGREIVAAFKATSVYIC